MSEWTNQDGLTVVSGVDEAKDSKVSEYTTSGPSRLIEIDISAVHLPASGAATIYDRFCKIPSGVLIERGEIIVTTAFDSAGDTADLHVSLVDADDETSNAMTVVVDATVAELTATGRIENGTSPLDGNAFGAITGQTKVVSVLVDDQAFTAGKGVVRIWYSVPQTPTDALGT